MVNYPLFNGNTRLPEIALTFDDGPNPFYTPQILAILQLYGVQASLIDLSAQRAQLDHAIAVLIGKPPSESTIPEQLLNTLPPPVPVGVPSELLERRPDIAAAERRVAAANEQIGIAMAAFYPH